MSKKAQELAARYGRKSDIIEIVQEIIDEQYHVNAFSNPVCPVVTESDELQAYNWGLIPFWVKDIDRATDMRLKTINAKAETIFELPSFKNPIISRRCIVPSTGFFEWQQQEKRKQPYYITVKGQDVFSMAGIFDIWQNPADKRLYKTFSIITTEANELMAEIHNVKKRMPVILRIEDEQRWLDPTINREQIKSFLKPFDSNSMDAYAISPDFLKMNPRDPAIINRA